MSNFFDETTSSIVEPEKEESLNDQQNISIENDEQQINVKQQKNSGNQNYAAQFLYHPQMNPIEFQSYLNSNVKIVVEKQFLDEFIDQDQQVYISGHLDYVSDGDLLAMLLHSGLVNKQELQRQKFECLYVIFNVKKIKKIYQGILINGILSQFSSHQAVSKHCNLKPVEYQIIKKLSIEEYCYLAEKQSLQEEPQDSIKERSFGLEWVPCLGDIVFNHFLEPAFKYSIINIYQRLSRNEEVLKQVFGAFFVVFYTEDKYTYGLFQAQPQNINEFSLIQFDQEIVADNFFFSQNKFAVVKQSAQVIMNQLEPKDFLFNENSFVVREYQVLIDWITSFKLYPKIE